jgi:asparagine synthase (glutamine-hydrolysing)
MSILIGYWTNSNESQSALQRLLTQAIAGFDSNSVKVEASSVNRSSDPSAKIKSSKLTAFGIAVHGRNATLESQGDSGLTASLAVAGEMAEPDIWIEASVDRLVLGRESFGRATLFWTRTGSALWFASRLELLLRVIDQARVSIGGFYAYGCMSYIPAPLTAIENIAAVPAGAELSWSRAKPEAEPQKRRVHEWREADEQLKDEKTAAIELRRLLEENATTQLKLSRREPVGVFLSGGLDSSVTAALLARAGAKVRAYTLDFGNDSFSEVPYAELVAQHLKISLTKIPVTPDCLRRLLGPTTTRLDGLYGDGVTVALSLLYKRASKDVGIVFNGEGGDQLFAGWTNKPLIAASLYETDGDQERTFLTHYMRTFHRLHGHEASVYPERVLRQIDRDEVPGVVAQALDPTYTKDLLHRLRRANLLLKGADNIQPRATNLGLSYKLDVRTLFCSLPLADWTFRVRGELWLRGGCEKYLLKRAVEDLLPPEVVWREKRGMGVPLTLWLTGPLRSWALRQLSHRRPAIEAMWQKDLAQRVVSGELSGQIQGRRIGETLWLMLTWQAWTKRVLNLKEPVRAKLIRSWKLPLPFTGAPKGRYT